MQRLKILTWHVHGSYLYYLSQAPHDFFVPFLPERIGDYAGRIGHHPWGDNLIDVPAEQVHNLDLDCILYQRPSQYLEDRFRILTREQRHLPSIYLEHDCPRQHPTNTAHVVNDPNVLLVHVTHFNELMWDSNRTPTKVIEHGVLVPPNVRYTGEIPRGIVVINNPASRGRLVGCDLFQRAARYIPLDLVGMETAEVGGLGEVLHHDLPAFESRYRFFFHPVRYTSLGLAVCEAMMVGMPVVGLATTELAATIRNHVNGFVDTNLQRLLGHMQHLLDNPDLAHHLGAQARKDALERFHISRFVHDWNEALSLVTGTRNAPHTLPRHAHHSPQLREGS